MRRLLKIVLFWVIIVVILLAVISRYLPPGGQPVEISYSTLLDDVKAKRVDSVILQSDMLYGTFKDEQQFKTPKPQTDYGALMSTLDKAGVSIGRRPAKQPHFLAWLLLLLGSLLLILAFVRRSADS